jgi:hypothetical protein
MNLQPAAKQLTLQEIEALSNTFKAKTAAEGYTIAARELPDTDGPIASKMLFVDKATTKLVYEFYRARNKENKIYIIY